MTTTYAEFSFFLDTKAEKSLCYGPGLMADSAINEPVEFIIQARNEQETNRESGRDEFQVTIKTREAEPVEIPATITDANNGKYYVKYTLDRECSVDVKISYKNNKEQWVKLRGSPYEASFSAATPAANNHLTGPAMVKHVQKKIEMMQNFMKSTNSGCVTKGKDLADV